MEHTIHVLDLEFQNAPFAIASFLVETEDGLVLIETGPDSTFPTLEKRLNEKGYKASDIRHVLLSHIHFDHAGAAWHFADHGATIYVHPIGAKHLAAPDKLWNSAKRIYQDEMEVLWGQMQPIPQEKLRIMKHGDIVQIGNLEFQSWHTPGHAIHHIAWQLGTTMFTGDVAGVSIHGGPIVPPCPPPDIDLEDWLESISFILRQDVKDLFLTHFGRVDDPKEHMIKLITELDVWADWVKQKLKENLSIKEMEPLFNEFVEKRLVDEGADNTLLKTYEYANPAWMSVAGLARYWKKKWEKSSK